MTNRLRIDLSEGYDLGSIVTPVPRQRSAGFEPALEATAMGRICRSERRSLRRCVRKSRKRLRPSQVIPSRPRGSSLWDTTRVVEGRRAAEALYTSRCRGSLYVGQEE